MKKLIAVLALSGAAAVQAAPQTVTLDVPGMTCEACPITVKKAIITASMWRPVKVPCSACLVVIFSCPER